ncbi:hypothetical protein DXG03_005801 [Asterophora parasitica]|uniref:RING-type domain-containing protein n=1 Tax=Asterophora parasitica TaxID=117018 RepID=A0A9P7KF43_9AGAR|nr:hypothetical protein DXG03_005801 [Asterophora parasitica]
MPISEGRPDNYSEDDCAICFEKLLIPATTGEVGPSHIIDDIKLQCNHHYHWSCFEEYDRASEANRAKCPLCRRNTLDASGRLIADVVNEGGFSGAVDLGDIFDRDRWEDEQPEEWKKAQALLSLCQFGEYEDAEELLRDKGGNPDAAYEDGTTGLHIAALNNSVEWASLLLRYGANKELKTDEGATALDYARSANAQDVINLIRR